MTTEVKEVAVIKVEGGFITRTNQGDIAVHQNYGQANKAVRAFLGIQRGAADGEATPAVAE